MAAEHSVLLDLNVVLDVLQKREPHYAASAQVWAFVETGRLQGWVAAHSVTTLFYLLTQQVGSPRAQEAIQDLVSVFGIASIDEKVILDALAFGWKDFEDAVQMAAAATADAEYLITRNPKDFKGGPVATLQPAELPAILQELEGDEIVDSA